MSENPSPNQLFQSLSEDISKRQLYNCQERDRSVLTMATAMLGISLTFIDKVVNIDSATWTPLLALSWFGFVIAITATLLSFHSSQAGLEKLLEVARCYYLNGNESAFEKYNKDGNGGKIWTDRLNWISSIAFMAAVVLLVMFIGINICQRRKNMGKDNVMVNNGAVVPNLLAIPRGTSAFGANVPTIQPVAQSRQSTPPQSNGNASSK